MRNTTILLVALFITACTGRIEPLLPDDDEDVIAPDPDPTFECDGLPAVLGPFVITRAADAAPLEDALCVDGDLVLASVEASTLEIASIQLVRGDVVVGDNPGLESLSMPNLRAVEGELRFIDENFTGNPNLRSLSLPLLERASALRVVENPLMSAIDLSELTTIIGSVSVVETDSEVLSLPRLAVVGGDLNLPMNGSNALSVPQLTEVGGNLIISPLPTDNDFLERIEAPLLSSVAGDLFISGNLFLNDLQMPALDYIGGRLLVTGNHSLPALALPALELVDGDVSVRFDAGLEDLDLPALQDVGGDLTIRANDLLPACQVEALVTAINVVGVTDIGDNRAGCDCSVEPIVCL